MLFRLIIRLSLAALFITAAFPLFSQVVPAATQSSLPLSVGGGFSDFTSHYYKTFSGRLEGPTLWIDWNFYDAPKYLRGLGVEVEARDLNYGRTGTDAKLREDTAEGGAIYTWRHYRRTHFYGKFLIGYGSIDFNVNDPHYSHDSRNFYSPGAGVEIHAWRNIWVRGDYEYQFWTHFGLGTLEPHGFTVGALYNFRHIHPHF
ncbi:MAG: outer membrane beta-barrel protein [Terracidiphilus sp.]